VLNKNPLAKIKKRCRAVVWTLLGFVLVCLAIGLVYLDRVGVPSFAKAWIVGQLEEQELYVDFDRARFSCRDGFLLEGCSCYNDEDKTPENLVFSGSRLELDAYKILFWMGKFKLRNVRWQGCDVQLEGLTSTGEKAKYLFYALSGEVAYDRDGSLALNSIRGGWNGLEFRLNGELPKLESKGTGTKRKDVDPFDIPSQLVDVLETLKEVQLSPEDPHEVEIHLKRVGYKQWHVGASVELGALMVRDLALERSGLTLRYDGGRVSLDSLTMQVEDRFLKAEGELKMETREFDLKLTSSLNFSRIYHELLEEYYPVPIPFDVQGDFEFDGRFRGCFDEKNPSMSGFGLLELEDATVDGIHLNQASAKYAFDGGDFVVKQLSGGDGEDYLSGEIIKKGPLLSYDLKAKSLPTKVIPTLRSLGFYVAIKDFAEYGDKAWCEFHARGYRKLDSEVDWKCELDLAGEYITYREIPIRSMSGQMEFTAERCFYRNMKAQADYTDYSLRKRYGGSKSGNVFLGELKHERSSNHLVFKDVSGKAWPAPVLRMFLPEVADHLEMYRFHQPPSFNLSGVVDISGKEAHRLRIDFDAGRTNYDFLEVDTPLDAVSGRCDLVGLDVRVSDLDIKALGGELGLDLTVSTAKEPFAFKGDVTVRGVEYAKVAHLHSFEQENDGYLAGTSSFSGLVERPRSLQGQGSMVMTDAKLLSIPMFGPLSGVLDKIFVSEGFFQQKATDLSADFVIVDGVASSTNFLTKTGAFKFKGKGWVDLVDQEMNLVIETAGRGVMRLLTVPLSPVFGLLRFRGEGPIDLPKWSLSPYGSGETEKADDE